MLEENFRRHHVHPVLLCYERASPIMFGGAQQRGLGAGAAIVVVALLFGVWALAPGVVRLLGLGGDEPTVASGVGTARQREEPAPPATGDDKSTADGAGPDGTWPREPQTEPASAPHTGIGRPH